MIHDQLAIALDTRSVIWALLFISEVLGITMTSTGVAGRVNQLSVRLSTILHTRGAGFCSASIVV